MHVGIVGSGVSGLYTALLLRREGHKVTLFEAANRIGGRIFTYHFTPQSRGEAPYFEAGAMRIPRSSLHSKVFDFVRYLNTHSAAEDRVEFIPYILDHENNLSFFQNKKGLLQDSSWATDAGLPEKFQGQTPQQLLGSVVLPWLALLRKDFESGFKQLLRYDSYSFRSYLLAETGWPHEVIDFVELFCSQTNQYDLSFTDIVMQNLDFDTNEWVTIRNGMSRMTQCAASLVGSKNIRLNSRVNRIVNEEDGRVTLSSMELGRTRSDTFDSVVLAIPPSAISSIVDRPQWSFMKEQSIRGMHYECLYKIGLHFRSRFWERSTRNPCFGGQSTTDLRFRWIVYPSNDLGGNGSGVLLLYCWMSDAAKWATMPQEERIKVCLHDLNRFYADEPEVDVYDQYISAFDIAWSSDSSSGDAMFLPGQFSRYFDVAKKREGQVYFVGEHLSKHHTWIAGALDSALHTTAEILGRSVEDETAEDSSFVRLSEPLPALGREFFTKDAFRKVRRTDISSRHFKACQIPQHMNVQYVDVF